MFFGIILQMKNERTLIIPDIHLRWQEAEEIIGKVKHDKVLFLGDYFDDFGDNPEMIENTCNWLEGSVKKPNRIHLFGNHDVHYAFVYRTLVCSGYEQWKYFIIHDTLPSETWEALKWYYVLDNTWLVSHAGLHRFNLPEKISKLADDRPTFLSEIAKYLDEEIKNAFRSAANNQPSWVLNAGFSRGGSQRVGGITWCDFEREFHPIRGLNQIVGHTPQGLGFPKYCHLEKSGKVSYPPCHAFTPTPEMYKNTKISINVNLDVYKNTHYGIWDGKNLRVGSHKDL